MRGVLEELRNRPAHYPYPEAALYAAVRLTVCPAPDEVEWRRMLTRLENDGYVYRDDTPLGGVRWSITALGRASLAD